MPVVARYVAPRNDGLKRLIRDSQTTQRELAQSLGINERYLSQIVSGLRLPSGELMTRMAEELAVDLGIINGLFAAAFKARHARRAG